jgi:putative ABC transport system ATP-binding protein
MTTKQLTAFRRDYLGFIFQTFNLFPTLSAQDNIALSLAMRRVPGREASQRAGDLLNQVGLWHRRKARPAQLSGGECQRVAVARALAGDPAVVFADEPTASLDAENGQAVMQLLTRLVRERGVTLVVVTHDNRIFSYADRVLRLEDGCMAHEWVPTETTGPAEPASSLSPERLRFLKEHVA